MTDETTAIQEELDALERELPEWIDSAAGDMVFRGQDGYSELLISWRAMRRAEILEDAESHG